MKIKLDKILTLLFSVFWILIISLDYWYYHPGYALSIKYFQYLDTFAFLTLLGGGAFWALKKLGDKKWLSYLTGGAGVFVLLMLISAIILWSHYYKASGQALGILDGLTYLGKITYVLASSYFIFGTCYVLGALFLENLFSVSFKKRENILIKLGLGITLVSIILIILGAFKVLKMPILVGLFLVILGVGWKQSLFFLKSTLITSLNKQNKIQWYGFVALFLTLVFISLNLFSNVRPIPFGFDALALYLNLPNLIGEYQGLIDGFSPYYWSLFIAMGHIIFDQTEITIALSMAGGILSLFAIYEISRKWLNIDYSLLTVFLFYSIPVINYQSFRDIKTDLGLLYILLVIVLVLIYWLMQMDANPFRKKNKIATGVDESSEEPTNKGFLSAYVSESNQLIILLGILSGMALGIKLTGLIIILSVLSVFSYIKGDTLGFLANFFLTFFVLLMAGLDTTLRVYHYGTGTLKVLTLIIGLLGLLYMGYKERSQLWSLVKVAFIYILFLGLVYMPWPIKNYQETGVINIETITGKR